MAQAPQDGASGRVAVMPFNLLFAIVAFVYVASVVHSR